MWCDTLPSTPAGAAEVCSSGSDTVRNANSLTPLADPTIERWLTDADETQRPADGSRSATPSSAPRPQAISAASPRSASSTSSPACHPSNCPCSSCAVAEDAGPPPAENRRIVSLVPGARYEEIANARHSQRRAPRNVQPHHARLATVASAEGPAMRLANKIGIVTAAASGMGSPARFASRRKAPPWGVVDHRRGRRQSSGQADHRHRRQGHRARR